MTEKRFKVEKNIFDGYCIVDSTIDGYYAYDKQDLERLCDSLNELNDENEQLKQELKIKCIVNKQYEENQRLIKMLDNAANYVQREHREIPLDDFVEWWNNMVTEGLE